MMNHLRTSKVFWSTLACLFFAAGSASAATVNYSTSFSDSDSPTFADGQLNGQNSWVAHPNHDVSDAAGVGLVDHVNANGPVHIDSSADVTSELAAGKTITLTLDLNYVGTYVNQNSGAWILGIGSSAASTAQNILGGTTFFNNGGSNFFISNPSFSNGLKVDTGIPWDSAYHTLTTTITRSATTNVFDVTVDLDGQSTSYTISNAGLWSGASTAYAGFRFRGNQQGNVDSFSVSSVAIPEPASLVLMASACGVTLLRRSRS